MRVNIPRLSMMPWFPRDFASTTALWPLVARGVYRELLDLQWNMSSLTQAGLLPDDEEALRGAIRVTASEWKIAWPYVEPKFPLVAGGRQNERLEQHRQDSVKRYLARKKGADMTNVKLHRNGGEGHV